KVLAGQLLDRAGQGRIDLTPAARGDLEKTRDGIPIGSCGLQGGLHPALLNVLLKLSEPGGPYKVSISVFVTGHDCNGGEHPKGRAGDIQSINNGAVEDWDK